MKAQKKDLEKEKIIERLVESMPIDSDNQLNSLNTLQHLEYYDNHPIDLNNASKSQLEELNLLTDLQINALLAHIKRNGALIQIEELQSVNHFDKSTINRIRPFITIHPKHHQSIAKKKTICSHRLYLRYQQNLEPHLETDYYGSPYQLYNRYQFNKGNYIRLGFTAEKDAGEEFFRNSQKKGFDFYSAFIMIRTKGTLNRIIIGDFSVQFGQGLTAWNGFSTNKSSEITTMKQRNSRILPYTSANEFNFMRGLATTLNLSDKIQLNVFGSTKRLDANLNDNSIINSFSKQGLHRTAVEIGRKNKVGSTIVGGRLSRSTNKFSLGANLLRRKFSHNLKKRTLPYQFFNSEKKESINFGVDYTIMFKNISSFGEISHSADGGTAFISGVIIALNKLSTGWLYRNYQKDFLPIFSSSFSESTTPNNEKGFYTVVNIELNEKWSLKAYADYFQFPWLRYQTNQPSNGFDYLFQSKFSYSENLHFTFRIKTEKKDKNQSKIERQLSIQPTYQNSYRYQIEYRPTDYLQLKSRLEMKSYQHKPLIKEHGILIFQDFQYQQKKSPIRINLRAALFETDSYNSRIYAYEKDVLFAYSIPSYYGIGSRGYLMFRYQPIRQITCWIRVARTLFINQTNASSSPETTSENRKTSIRAQLRFSF